MVVERKRKRTEESGESEAVQLSINIRLTRCFIDLTGDQWERNVMLLPTLDWTDFP